VTSIPLSVAAVVTALVAAAWAALLGLSEESPKVARALADTTPESKDPTTRYRVIHLSRLALLFIAGMAGASAIEWWRHDLLVGLGVASVSVGFLYMVAEALPRAVGVLAPDLAAAAAPTAERTAQVFRPLLAIVSAVERGVRALFPGPRSGDNGFGSAHRDLVMGVFSLGETTVGEIMTPRLDVVALDDRDKWRDVVDVVRRSEHARIVVYTDTLDNVTGILYAKDLVSSVGGITAAPKRWQDLVRPALFVPESKPLTTQLRDFQRGPAHIAVVVDEFGGTAGLVTLEDILEEVVGEIHGEYDVDEGPAIEREGQDKFWIDGGVTLDELSALLETDLEKEDVSTVGGLVYAELGRVPNPGDEFRLGEFRVVVERVVRHRIRRVYFERLALPDVEPDGEGGNA
jgi:CBS domain containing-hemolysin-like protein